MQRLLLFILFFAFTFAAAASSLRGSLNDKVTGEPLVGATVYLKGSSLGTSVGLDGSFNLKNVPAGKYVLVASLVGYSSIEKSIDVQDGKDLTVNFSLEENANELSEIVVTGSAEVESDLSVRRAEQISAADAPPPDTDAP